MKKIITNIAKNHDKIRNFIAIILYKLNLLPKEFEGRVRSIYLTKKYNKQFKKLSLNYDKAGFYSLNPMPSEDFLKKYYKDTYWPSRTDKNYPIRLRDIEHYKFLIKKYPSFNDKPKKILNFGAGHGGVSFFLHTLNHDIYNFEPGGIKEYFSDRWRTIDDIKNIKFKFDLIYGSHSLEHVQDIKKTLSQFKRLSDDNTIFFFEVPNCPKEKKIPIEPPHTYYFNTDFFYNSFSKVNYCKTFRNYKEQNDNNGEVIIFISQTNVSNKLSH
tara:strand:+ start:552 stop:1361 length:810 start_codon:yes stop_codon:yes gene_type:complete